MRPASRHEILTRRTQDLRAVINTLISDLHLSGRTGLETQAQEARTFLDAVERSLHSTINSLDEARRDAA